MTSRNERRGPLAAFQADHPVQADQKHSQPAYGRPTSTSCLSPAAASACLDDQLNHSRRLIKLRRGVAQAFPPPHHFRERGTPQVRLSDRVAPVQALDKARRRNCVGNVVQKRADLGHYALAVPRVSRGFQQQNKCGECVVITPAEN